MFRKISRDRLPGFAKVRGLMDEGIAIVHEVKIDADVGGSRIKRRRGDAGDRPKRRQSGYAFRDVGPIGRAVLGVPDLAVIRSCPYQTLMIFGGRNGEDNFPVELTEVVAIDTSRGNDVAGILR